MKNKHFAKMIRIDINRGLDISLGEAVQPIIEEVVPDSVAVQVKDFVGLRANLAVEMGATVDIGDVVFTDSAFPKICYTAPASGIVEKIVYKPQGVLEAIIISVTDTKLAHGSSFDPPLTTHSQRDICDILQNIGLWSAFRVHSRNQVPPPEELPDQLYVTAIDTHPLAPEPLLLIGENFEAFERGMALVARLCSRTVLCISADESFPGLAIEGLSVVEFSGPHPAGLVGTHIHKLARYDDKYPPRGRIWHVGYQDVIAMGKLSLTGCLDTSRTVSLAGPASIVSQRIRTLTGASLADIVGNLDPAGNRIISGSVLSGRQESLASGFLGRYHNQIVVLPPEHALPACATGMLTLEAFDSVWPFNYPPVPLLRALLTGDTETARALGCTHLAEEDLALCSYVCPSQHDYGLLLRLMLSDIDERAT